MDVTACILNLYALARMNVIPQPNSIIGRELARAYEKGYREYELFYEQDSAYEFILCLWTSSASYTSIAKNYPEFFGYRYTCYLSTGAHEFVGSFCIWDKALSLWTPYKPRLR